MKCIYLSNTLSIDDFPDNKPNKFTNLLNEELVFDGQWLVNLHEICYGSQTWYNIRNSNNKINVKLSNIIVVEIRTNRPFKMETNKILECEIPIGEYLSGVDLMQEILNAINHVIYKFMMQTLEAAKNNNLAHPLASKYELHNRSGHDWITRTGEWGKPQPKIVIDE